MFSATASRSFSAATIAAAAYFQYAMFEFGLNRTNTVAKNQALHAAHALIVFADRDIEWGAELRESKLAIALGCAESVLAKFGNTEWENVPLPFEGGKFNRKLCATYPQELR